MPRTLFVRLAVAALLATGMVTATPSPAAAAPACSVAYQVTVAWPGGPTWQAGFQAQISVTDTGATPTTGWQVTLTFDPGVTLWNVFYAQVIPGLPPTYTFTSLPFNAVIPVGSTMNFGLQARKTADAVPAVPKSISCTAS